jgi:hypothetical protein
VSPSKRTSTTTRTSKRTRPRPLSEADKKAWLTTWQDSNGVRHDALAKREDEDLYLVDVFTACEGYIGGALDNTGTEMVVTCVACMNSSFKAQGKVMNIDAIDHLDDSDLLDYFLDHDAMSALFNPW